jgi:hypothetical protein
MLDGSYAELSVKALICPRLSELEAAGWQSVGDVRAWHSRRG